MEGVQFRVLLTKLNSTKVVHPSDLCYLEDIKLQVEEIAERGFELGLDVVLTVVGLE